MKNWTPKQGQDVVAVIISIGIALVVVLFVFAAVIDAFNKDTELSDNATQVLTGAIGGMIGIVGGYIGGRASERARKDDEGSGR